MLLRSIEKIKSVLKNMIPFPKLIAHDLVSVQPMTVPLSSIFYMQYEYPYRLKPGAVVQHKESKEVFVILQGMDDFSYLAMGDNNVMFIKQSDCKILWNKKEVNNA